MGKNNKKQIKNGIIFGKFYPLHTGHVDFIQRASGLSENLYVIVCTDKKRDIELFEKSQMKKMPTEKDRIRFAEQTFKYQDNIKILHLSEDNIPPYPNGWKEWTKRVKELLSENHLKIDTIFTNETQDVENYKKNFVDSDNSYEVFDRELKVETIDTLRNNFHISATEVRKNPYHNWQYIPKYVREFFVLKVAIIGSENSGKTNLTNKLANYYNTSCVREYRKKYIEEVLAGKSDNMQYEDYSRIAYEHNREITDSGANADKLTFIDTEYTSLQVFSIINTGEEHPVIKDFIKNSKFNIIIYIEKDRNKEYDKILKKLLEKYNIKYFTIKNEECNFTEIYNKSIEIIDDFISI
ncbi:multifunctional transcriptional regulator/nicotinamide-nucleotide adenylyltransferase/ribosylnicotinamide kinase NadR [Pseudoleptotrichia goodfellowii]|uniref:Nicotinamide-nucleotide adenylyltransferase n=1 Tax=Pseudoleptotrichia goodfellowii TaxID=157692 RepID=A0A510JBR9_9FUSO|nr:multifunctional transcriptional regulator/nicotinamide-nucleotide adenylyltransferase/ribosylnicotinamide kinase NadR [Pseudoleptotrichia goodfellowii]BBM36732.1 nicotinamide-nucleotide adenylyltransferase [Pseudoleptotrichia goodfellowii]